MPKLKSFMSIFLISLFLIGVACQAEEAPDKNTIALLPSMLGSWQVVDVLVDQGNSRWNQTRDDKYNIYKFLGRLLTITPERLSINDPSDHPCDEPGFSLHKSTAAKIIAKSISSRVPDPSHPTPVDMRFPLANNAQVDVLYLTCKDKMRAKDPGMRVFSDRTNALWFIVLSKQKLAMSWHDETVLILSRVPEKATPIASFNCAKAETEVEKTICGSVGLAAYDQSVSQTYKLVRAYYRTKKNTKKIIADLKKSQRAWLKQRNACGSDSKCLEKVMSTRMDDMNYDLADYTYQNR